MQSSKRSQWGEHGGHSSALQNIQRPGATYRPCVVAFVQHEREITYNLAKKTSHSRLQINQSLVQVILCDVYPVSEIFHLELETQCASYNDGPRSASCSAVIDGVEP